MVENNGMLLIAIVALVAVIGILGLLVLNAGQTATTAVLASMSGSGASPPAAEPACQYPCYTPNGRKVCFDNVPEAKVYDIGRHLNQQPQGLNCPWAPAVAPPK